LVEVKDTNGLIIYQVNVDYFKAKLLQDLHQVAFDNLIAQSFLFGQAC
jgi:hypothetical protein